MTMKVVVYGVGGNFNRNYEWLENNYEIVALVDGNADRQGILIKNFQVLSMEQCEVLEYDKIIITPNWYKPIKKALLDYGIPGERILALPEEMKIVKDDRGRTVKVLMKMDGGMGDQLISLNYGYYFKEKYGSVNMDLDVVCGRGRELTEAVVGKQEWFCFFDKEEVKEEKYDLILKVGRYPEVLQADMHHIARCIPDLIDYIFLCQKFQAFYPEYFDEEFIADGSSALWENTRGKKRVQQPDIYEHLDVTEDYKIPIAADAKLLRKYQLEENKYITIHRGCEQQHYSDNAVKLWDMHCYRRLIELLKEKYPQIPIVAIGAEYEQLQDVACDRDCVGKTNTDELKTLLKYSRVHIDTEGGLVHLRKALRGGVSVVLFGATSELFFGYSTNINIRTNACPYPCEWVTSDWQKECFRETEKKICMQSITPEMVMEYVEKYIEGTI